MSELTHVAPDGSVHMVDVGAKEPALREAIADAVVRFHSAETYATLMRGDAPKGDVLGTARIAGIMAAKRTPDLIPLCHTIALDHAAVELEPDADLPGVRITATVRCRAVTGVEMEALTAATVAALTVIDMLKAVDRWITVERIGLREKRGGRHGTVVRPADGAARG